MPQRRRDTKQFKEEALRLVSQEGVSLTPVAQQPGASPSSAHNREIIVSLRPPGNGCIHSAAGRVPKQRSTCYFQ